MSWLWSSSTSSPEPPSIESRVSNLESLLETLQKHFTNIRAAYAFRESVALYVSGLTRDEFESTTGMLPSELSTEQTWELFGDDSKRTQMAEEILKKYNLYENYSADLYCKKLISLEPLNEDIIKNIKECALDFNFHS